MSKTIHELIDDVRDRLLDHTDNLEEFVDEAVSVYNYISGIIVEEVL